MAITKSLFISFSSHDAELAGKLRSVLENLVGVKDRIFLSSVSVKGGNQWLKEIDTALAEGRDLLILLTPESLYSPWVHYETGGTSVLSHLLKTSVPSDLLRRTKREEPPEIVMLPVLSKGLTINDLPTDAWKFFDALGRQCLNLNSRSGVRTCLEQVSRSLRHDAKSPTAAQVTSVFDCAKGTSGWKRTCRMCVATPLGESPFEFRSLIESPKTTRMLVAGQNLHALVRYGLLKLATRKLREESDFQLQFLIADKDFGTRGTTIGPFLECWSLWQTLDFVPQLEQATNVFSAMKRRHVSWCKRNGRKCRLEVKVTKFLPFSATFVWTAKPGEEFALITALAFEKPMAGERPVFRITERENPEAFRYHWQAFHQLWISNNMTRDLPS